MVVENVSQVVVRNVMVVYALQGGTPVKHNPPMATEPQSPGNATWKIETLQPGGRQEILLTIKPPPGAVEFESKARVIVDQEQTTKTKFAKTELKVAKTGPKQALRYDILVFGITDPVALRSLPVTSNPYARRYDWSSLLEAAPALLVIPGTALLFVKRARRERVGRAVVIVRRRRWVLGCALVLVGAVALVRGWPFTVDPYSPYADFGVAPYQDLIDHVKDRARRADVDVLVVGADVLYFCCGVVRACAQAAVPCVHHQQQLGEAANGAYVGGLFRGLRRVPDGCWPLAASEAEVIGCFFLSYIVV